MNDLETNGLPAPLAAGAIEIADGQHAFAPGERLAGSVRWRLPDDPAWVALRLYWRTEGKGTQDVDVVTEERFEAPGRDDRRPFDFPLPEGPYSFSGKLITLVWGLELVAEPGGAVAQTDLVISPTGAELRLAPPEGRDGES